MRCKRTPGDMSRGRFLSPGKIMGLSVSDSGPAKGNIGFAFLCVDIVIRNVASCHRAGLGGLLTLKHVACVKHCKISLSYLLVNANIAL